MVRIFTLRLGADEVYMRECEICYALVLDDREVSHREWHAQLSKPAHAAVPTVRKKW